MKDDTGGIREERRSVPLETHDKELARRKMKKVVAMLASGELVADAAEAEADAAKAEAEAAAAKEETFEVYAPARSSGVAPRCAPQGMTLASSSATSSRTSGR